MGEHEDEFKVKFWAYRHINGGIHVKRYTLPDDLESAYESDFVDEVLDPYEASNRTEAEKIAVERLSKKV